MIFLSNTFEYKSLRDIFDNMMCKICRLNKDVEFVILLKHAHKIALGH